MNLLDFIALVVQMFYFKIKLSYPVSSVSASVIDKSTDRLRGRSDSTSLQSIMRLRLSCDPWNSRV